MRYLFATLLFFVSLPVFAQKDFEGMIRYKVNTPEMIEGVEKNGDEVKMFFTAGKILLRTNKSGESEEILIVLDSAHTVTVNRNTKSYEIKKLRTIQPRPVAEKEVVAGYMSTPVQSGGIPALRSIGGHATIWFADSLYFRVPASLEGNDELLMVHNNHIMLKAVIKINENRFKDEYPDNSEPETTNDQITLMAIEVVPGAQPASLFAIPDDYTRSELEVRSFTEDSTTMMLDTAAWILDTTVAAEPVKPTPVKKTVPKLPAKKKQVTNKAPIKKEE